MVADRDRRHPHIATARKYDIEARLLKQAVSRCYSESLKEDGSPAGVNEGGYLVIEKPWPGMIRGTYGDSEMKGLKKYTSHGLKASI